MSWITDFVGKLTIAQAKALVQFWELSEMGQGHPKMEATGCDYVIVEWIGWDIERATVTHCRISVDHPDIVDIVLPAERIPTLAIELKSELSRAFDKPNESPFRRSDRS